MKIHWILIGLAAAAAAGGCGRKSDTSAGGSEPLREDARILWVQDGMGPVTSAVQRAELLGLCREWEVTGLVLGMDHFSDNQYNTNYLAGLEGFLSEASGQGLALYALHALLPSAELALRDNHYRAVVFVRQLMKYNETLPRQARFRGYLEDIDPSVLPGWKDPASGLQQSFSELVWAYRLDFMEHAPGIELGWVVPSSFDTYPWATSLYAHLDFLVVKGAGDRAAMVEPALAEELARAGSAGRKVVWLVETRDLAKLGLGLSSDTFAEEGWQGLDGETKLLGRNLRKDSAYGGILIRDFATLKSWSQRRSNTP